MLNYIKTYLEMMMDDERGQGLVEYALIIALIAILLVLALGWVQGGIENVFNNIKNALQGTGALILK